MYTDPRFQSPKEESNGAIGRPDRLMRVADSDADEEDDNKIEREQRGNRNDAESVNTLVANTHTVEKDDSNPLQTRTGTKECPKENHLWIQPAGNRASITQTDLPSESSDQIKTNENSQKRK